MLILAVDTSGPKGSLALGVIGSRFELLGSASWSREKSASEEITSTLQSLISDLNISLSEIERLAVDVGPGSFTGLRVGINLIRGLGFGLNKSIFAVDSLRAQAGPVVKDCERTLSLRSAFRDLIYWSEYLLVDGRCVEKSPPTATRASELATSISAGKFQVVGDAWEKHLDLWPMSLQKSVKALHPKSPDAKDILFTLHDQPDLRRDLSWRETLPLYVRASEAEEKLRQGLLQPLPKV